MDKEKLFIQVNPQNTYKEYTEITIQNIERLFNMKEGTDLSEKNHKEKDLSKRLSLQHFIDNKDHGLEHAYNVYKKAMEISQIVTSETGEEIREDLIYPMTLAHDSARTITYPENDKNRSTKEKRNDRNHERYGGWIFRTGMNNLVQQGMEKPNKEVLDIVEDYLRNHDFLSEQLNGKRFHEPVSIEGQICRLADRISVPLKDEITRYWDTGKRLGTKFFIKDVPYEVRETMSFDNLGEYFKHGYVDEVMFFTSILMTKGSDFSHPVLARLYDEWAIQKKDAVDYIFAIAKEENASQADIADLKKLLTRLGQKYNFIV